MYHPDKHATDAQTKDKAEKTFNKIRTAHNSKINYNLACPFIKPGYFPAS